MLRLEVDLEFEPLVVVVFSSLHDSDICTIRAIYLYLAITLISRLFNDLVPRAIYENV